MTLLERSSDMQWTIDGAEGEAILGDAHTPAGDAAGVVLIVHGFLGYKDYGMFPCVGRAMADAGLVAHRFNLSHSGMTNHIETFERADLFERDTWNKQVFDIGRVMDAVDAGELPGGGLPIVLLGHSRGGTSVLLAAGRRFRDGAEPAPAGVITLAAPSACDRLGEEARRSLEERGYHEVVSNRTGQTLRMGRAWLDEQRASPEDHDVLALAGEIRCPVLVAHGSDDPTVPASDASEIASACPEAEAFVIDGADHVLNTPNPMLVDAQPSRSLSAFVDRATAFAKSCVARRR